jgi:hypothetical protein
MSDPVAFLVRCAASNARGKGEGEGEASLAPTAMLRQRWQA